MDKYQLMLDGFVFVKFKTRSYNARKILYENRYCNQDGFSVLVCGGTNITGSKPVKSVFKLHNTDFKCEKYIDMPEALYGCKTVVIDSDLFVFSG